MYEPMSELVSQLSERELAELAALADGTLRRRSARRGRGVGRGNSRAPGAARAPGPVARPHRALGLTSRRRRCRRTSRACGGSRERRDGRSCRGRCCRCRHRRSVVAAVVLTGGPGAPSVAQAAGFAAKVPTEPAPTSAGGSKLAADIQGVAFPDYAQSYGWRALGARRGQVGGRDAIVVYYGKGGRRLAYVIVSGEGLPSQSGGQTTRSEASRTRLFASTTSLP